MASVSVHEDTDTHLDAPELPPAVKSAIPDTIDDADEGEEEIAVKEGVLCLFFRVICNP